MSRSLDGVDDKIQDSSSPVTAYPMTLACWFNKDNATSNGTLISVTDTAANADWFRISAAGADAGDPISLDVNQGGGGDFQVSTTSTGFIAAKWHFATGVFGSSASRDIYIDAGSKGSNTNATTAPVGVDVLAA